MSGILTYQILEWKDPVGLPAAGTDAAVVSQCLVRVAAVVAAASVAGSSVLQPGSSLPL